jgi:mono/diheme cytochrome c family protein
VETWVALLPFACLFLFLCAAAQRSAPASQKPKSQPASTNPPAVLAAGKAVYEKRCAICHFSQSDAKKIGPGLKGLYANGKFSDGAKVTDAAVTAWIENGGTNMPGYRDALKIDELRALIAYVKTL